ncbi:MAG TPA: hypothetical protein VHJ99_04105 [Candidatus Dormibacteraeota bacterium]|jgi:capsular polysaccharide biosynthesis protein|nr:hypothetical protein [Candidatus Dormibacteraeota bacterium]
MDLQEVARRILLGHWVVILGLVLVSAGGVTAYHLFDTPTYSASTRVVLDAPAPTAGAEATAIADSAKAIVTSPTHIIAALNAAGYTRDPVKVAADITLAPLGTSGVLQLTVKDSDPVAAAAIANALAADLIQTRLAVSPAARKAALDAQIKTATDRISALDADIRSLNDQLKALQVDPANPSAAGVRAQILSDRITADSNERSALTQELINLDSQRASLGSSSDTTPSVIDLATIPTKPDPSRLPIDLALALIVGSVLGVAAAAVLEMFRPTLASGDAVAKALAVPVLGWLPDIAGTLPMRLKLAATAADVRALELIGLGETIDLSALARNLRGQLTQGQSEGKGLAIFSIEDAPARYRNGQAPPSGFVLIAPERIRKAALAPVLELIALSGRPLLGLIAHKPDRAEQTPLPPAKPMPRLAVVLDGERDTIKGMSKEMQSDLWGAQ